MRKILENWRDLVNRDFLAIIPARGESKRLKRKNLLEIGGKPLVALTIETALKSKYIDRIVLSSDDEKILEIAINYDIIPIKRPKSLATDSAKTIDVVKHVISELSESYKYIVLLQPTSPLRNENHIDEAINFLLEKNADAVISVCEVEHNPLWTNTLPSNKSMENFIKDEVKDLRSQDLPKFYRLNGAIYICDTERLIKENTFFISNNIYAYIMDRLHSIDIDEYLDYLFAKFIYENVFHKKV